MKVMGLDPSDREAFARLAHEWLDRMLDHYGTLAERPVWQPIPDTVRASFASPSPQLGMSLEVLGEMFRDQILPYGVGNLHPGFMGWVHGGGTLVGMLAEMLAAGMNANLGGRDQIPVQVEWQVGQWAREWFGFPEAARGVFTTGTSQATLMALWVARVARWGEILREEGWHGHRPRIYAAQGVHGSLPKALDLAGMGRKNLVRIPVDDRYRLDLLALSQAIEADRAAGYEPLMVVGTAGTVDIGAVDDLEGLATVCADQGLWFHVDGALGALACWSAELAPLIHGIERADSIAFDFHKWGQVPYDAGFLLVRDGAAQRRTFVTEADYLARATRGTAAGSDWPCDFGPDLSRGFRALKTWMTLKAYGTQRLGEAMADTCRLARWLAIQIERCAELLLMAPVTLNIVCFRYDFPVNGDDLNERIAVALQESGLAVLSTTRVQGKRVLRAALVNHRTTQADLQIMLDAVCCLGRRWVNNGGMA